MHIDLPSLGFCELAQGFFFWGGLPSGLWITMLVQYPSSRKDWWHTNLHADASKVTTDYILFADVWNMLFEMNA